MFLAVAIEELEKRTVSSFGCGKMHSRGGDDCGFVEAVGEVEHGYNGWICCLV